MIKKGKLIPCEYVKYCLVRLYNAFKTKTCKVRLKIKYEYFDWAQKFESF